MSDALLLQHFRDALHGICPTATTNIVTSAWNLANKDLQCKKQLVFVLTCKNLVLSPKKRQ